MLNIVSPVPPELAGLATRTLGALWDGRWNRSPTPTRELRAFLDVARCARLGWVEYADPATFGTPRIGDREYYRITRLGRERFTAFHDANLAHHEARADLARRAMIYEAGEPPEVEGGGLSRGFAFAAVIYLAIAAACGLAWTVTTGSPTAIALTLVDAVGLAWLSRSLAISTEV